MKSLLATFALITCMAFSTPEGNSVLCIGHKPQGGKVQLEERNGKNYIVHYNENGREIQSDPTDDNVAQFVTWCKLQHILTIC
jgi:hypothetical protein